MDVRRRRKRRHVFAGHRRRVDWRQSKRSLHVLEQPLLGLSLNIKDTMATFIMSKEYDVREDLDSPTLQAVRARAEEGTFKAYTHKLRHPRYKSKFSSPSFIASFRWDGKLCSESEDSLEALEKVLVEYYLSPPAATAAP